MERILVSIPNELAIRMRAAIPSRQRSKIITSLIEEEISKREHELYECALALENDVALNKEMLEWEDTVSDGLHNEPW